jgi:iron-sulfur cluster repair protein YtfE (RIC family)
MRTTSEQAVGEIAVANPASALVIEQFGIDYCCGGNHSLSIACERAHAPVELAAQLSRDSSAPVNPGVRNDANLGETTRYIVDRHHRFVRDESPCIQGLLLTGLLRKVREEHDRDLTNKRMLVRFWRQSARNSLGARPSEDTSQSSLKENI